MTDLQKLTRSFPQEAVKQRVIGGGFKADYVDGATVIRRLNEATDNRWDFTVDRYWIENGVSLALVTLTIPDLGSRQHIGVQAVNERSGEDAMAKGAITDALKKAATLFGVGLELYGPDYEGEGRQEKVQRGNGEARPQPKSNYPPRTDAPTNITAKAEKTITPMQKLHGLAKDRGLLVKGAEDPHAPLRCVCQFILPTVRNGDGYVPLTSMAQLTDANLDYLAKQIDETADNELFLMAVDYPAAIKAAQDLDTLEQIRTDLISIGAKAHTHPALRKAFDDRKAQLSPKLTREAAA